MFGRAMNTFENWTNKLLPNEESALVIRSDEIKKLVENLQQDAVQNIQKQQEKQIKIQNQSKRVDAEPLKTGQCVYIKNDGLLTKLEPKYKGPFTVIEQTSTGNYKLKDATGQQIERTVPRHKLKKVVCMEESEKESFEVEKILNHKEDQNGNIMYWVKWKN
jgi:hypothetical protein